MGEQQVQDLLSNVIKAVPADFFPPAINSMGTKVKLNIEGLRAAVLTFMPQSYGNYQPLWKGLWLFQSTKYIQVRLWELETTGS